MLKTTPIDHADPRFSRLRIHAGGDMEFGHAENLVWALYRTRSGNQSPALLVFKGRSKKALYHYLYQSEEKRDQDLAALIDNAKRERQEKELRRSKRNAGHNFREADIVYNAWGVEQTNIDFYVVVGTTKCYLKLRKVKSEFASHNASGMCGTVRPLPSELDSDRIKRCKAEGDFINFRYGGGGIWEGKPLFCSWYA